MVSGLLLLLVVAAGASLRLRRRKTRAAVTKVTKYTPGIETPKPAPMPKLEHGENDLPTPPSLASTTSMDESGSSRSSPVLPDGPDVFSEAPPLLAQLIMGEDEEPSFESRQAAHEWLAQQEEVVVRVE